MCCGQRLRVALGVLPCALCPLRGRLLFCCRCCVVYPVLAWELLGCRRNEVYVVRCGVVRSRCKRSVVHAMRGGHGLSHLGCVDVERLCGVHWVKLQPRGCRVLRDGVPRGHVRLCVHEPPVPPVRGRVRFLCARVDCLQAVQRQRLQRHAWLVCVLDLPTWELAHEPPGHHLPSHTMHAVPPRLLSSLQREPLHTLRCRQLLLRRCDLVHALPLRRD